MTTVENITQLKTKPYLIDIDEDKFGVLIIYHENENNQPKEIKIRDEYCFFYHLNELVFDLYGENIQDMLHTFIKKDIYNVLSTIYEKNKTNSNKKQKIIHFVNNISTFCPN
jgi:hypothetical protein